MALAYAWMTPAISAVAFAVAAAGLGSGELTPAMGFGMFEAAAAGGADDEADTEIGGVAGGTTAD